MTTAYDSDLHSGACAQAAGEHTAPVNAPAAAPAPVDGWVPEEREPTAAENNFMSFALFGFLILFGMGCFIIF